MHGIKTNECGFQCASILIWPSDEMHAFSRVNHKQNKLNFCIVLNQHHIYDLAYIAY